MRTQLAAILPLFIVGTATAQLSFRPASEAVAHVPPPGIVPLNAGQMITGKAQRYVYQAGDRVVVTEDFVSIQQLPLVTNGLSSQLAAVSDDGMHVLGQVNFVESPVTRAVIWHDLTPVPFSTNSFNQIPEGLSADGLTAVARIGILNSSSSWVQSPGGLQRIVIEPEDPLLQTAAFCISPDGLTVVGRYNDTSGPLFLWTAAAGGLLLPLTSNTGYQFVSNGGRTIMPTGPSVPAYVDGRLITANLTVNHLTPDGAFAVGWRNSDAMLWSRSLGAVRIADELTARGIDLRGWSLRIADYMSNDGTLIVGRGVPPGGAGLSWWIAEIAPLAAADIGKQGGLDGSDGVLDNNDFIVYINRFFASDWRADVGRQGGIPGPDGLFDNNDFCVFISQFFGACP